MIDEKRLRIVPVTFREACDFIASHHRHHRPTVGHKFSLKGKLKKIADHYGLQAQKGMLIEEMAELMQAVNRFDRNPIEKNLDAIAEEIADVEIMIAQAKYLYAIPQQKIDEITDCKIQRTLERMEVEK